MVFKSCSSTTKGHILEYAARLHNHFLDPVVMKNTRHTSPLAADYSIQTRNEISLEVFK
ncbi:hypothetical protein F4703DRAFT_1839089 [Phycomyces blakesleeanus]